MRISDWSSDVCSSDLGDQSGEVRHLVLGAAQRADALHHRGQVGIFLQHGGVLGRARLGVARHELLQLVVAAQHAIEALVEVRSEEHTSELQSLMRISYAVFCLKKKNNNNIRKLTNIINYLQCNN